MCFSATASFIAGGALSATGAVTLSKAKSKKEIPFAAIPLLFGVQQTIEGVVWLSFGSVSLNAVMTYAYSLFSHVLWPIFLPISVFVMETDPAHRKILRGFIAVGLLTGLYLLYSIIVEPVTSSIVNHSIAYGSPHLYPTVSLILYLFATCGSCFVSSHRIVRILGVAIFVAFLVAGWFYTETFFSVWCFFAAILSVIVFAQIRTGTGHTVTP